MMSSMLGSRQLGAPSLSGLTMVRVVQNQVIPVNVKFPLTRVIVIKVDSCCFEKTGKL